MSRGKVHTVSLLDAVIATGAGNVHQPWGVKRTFHIVGVVSATTGNATVQVQVSNDNVNFIDLHEFVLALTTSELSDKFEMDSPWRYVRGNVSVISGTDATIDLIMGNVTGF